MGQREFDDIGSAADNDINLSAKGGNRRLPSTDLVESGEDKCRCFLNKRSAQRQEEDCHYAAEQRKHNDNLLIPLAHQGKSSDGLSG